MREKLIGDTKRVGTAADRHLLASSAVSALTLRQFSLHHSPLRLESDHFHIFWHILTFLQLMWPPGVFCDWLTHTPVGYSMGVCEFKSRNSKINHSIFWVSQWIPWKIFLPLMKHTDFFEMASKQHKRPRHTKKKKFCWQTLMWCSGFKLKECAR